MLSVDRKALWRSPRAVELITLPVRRMDSGGTGKDRQTAGPGGKSRARGRTRASEV